MLFLGLRKNKGKNRSYIMIMGNWDGLEIVVYLKVGDVFFVEVIDVVIECCE